MKKTKETKRRLKQSKWFYVETSDGEKSLDTCYIEDKRKNQVGLHGDDGSNSLLRHNNRERVKCIFNFKRSDTSLDDYLVKRG